MERVLVSGELWNARRQIRGSDVVSTRGERAPVTYCWKRLLIRPCRKQGRPAAATVGGSWRLAAPPDGACVPPDSIRRDREAPFAEIISTII
ncbi:Hypothetical protein NTJ_09689 [Nesidiocoris tenuis]|uniref:Uncharacterized protein n=1 Tax=Nesidiocoris tenuis TaxID=355587 RepID=A0ABN7AXG9_9HEMI|nr:Hypothetical protein NTJ_09689 [Nesidiocoris tenuis]